MLRLRIILLIPVLALVTVMVATTTVPAAPTAHALSPADTVSGRVYVDTGVDGSYDAGFDTGKEGVTVEAYDDSGVKVATATTAADGTYTLTLDPVPTGAVRVEFQTPSGFQTVLARATGARSSIQFVDPGATDADYGIFDPTAYCEYSIASVCMSQGARTLLDASDARQNGVIHLSPFSPPATTAEFPVADKQDATYSTQVSTKEDTGATWGLGYQAKWGLLWNSAVIRRHAGLGPQGIGGVYVYDLEGNQVATFDLSTKGITLTDATSWTDPDRDIRTDTDAHSPYPTRSLVRLSRDIQGYSGVGKMGIGDIDVSIDGNSLFVANLYQRTIHRIAITGSAGSPTLGSVDSWNLDDGYTCAAGTGPFRAWAMDPQPDGTVIVSGQCTNEDAAPASNELPGAGVILALDPTASGAAAWTTLTTFAFDDTHTYDDCDVSPLTCTWKAWSDDWAAIKPLAKAGGIYFWDQPMVVNIEQLPDGSFVLGISDRLSYQLGGANFEPSTANYPEWVTGWVAGDTLLVCKTASGWTRETGGGCAGEHDYPVPPVGGDQEREGEFFSDTFNYSHVETTIGGLAYADGQIAVAAMDPAAYYTGGIRWLSVADGNQTNALTISPDSDLGFGKSAGMGDLEAICDGAPLQIGNRVWSDTDKDGIQDPGEVPIPGVTVRLYDSGGVLVGTAVTDENGEYYFTSSTKEPANGGTEPDAFGGGLVADASFTIRVDRSEDCDVGGALYLAKLTTQDATSATSPNSDQIDSDAAAVGSSWCDGRGVPTVTVSPRATGVVDHSLDIGFHFDSVSVGDVVFGDVNRNGVQDAGDVPLPNVELSILTCNGDPVTDIFGHPVTTTMTDDTGHYRFGNLPPGCYEVSVTTPTGFEPTTPDVGDPATDSSTGSAQSIDLTTDGQADLTLDFGFVALGVSVGDYVWNDVNGDGLQDATDVPLPGVELSILTCAGAPVVDGYGIPVTTTHTDAKGTYLFGDLPPGCYTVSVTTPDGYTPTAAGAGAPDVDSSTGSVASKVLTTAGEKDLSLDFGFVRVDATGSDPAGGLLAFTGSDTVRLGAVALLLVGAGALMLRRRRRSGGA